MKSRFPEDKQVPSDSEPEDSKDEMVAQVISGESIYSHLKIRHGGKQPMFEMECRIMVSLDRIGEVPEMVTDTMDKIYTKAQEKNILF